MTKKKKQRTMPLIDVQLVQLKVNVPEPVRIRFREEAEILGKNNDAYFLAIWDMHDEIFRKLLTQKKIDIEQELKK